MKNIDDLIHRLQQLRAENGNLEIAIEDADTDWHMSIQKAYIDERVPNRVLIRGAGYGDGILQQ